jgi:hypothetical protein
MTFPKSCAAHMAVDGDEVQAVPRRKKVAIIGFSATSVHLAPWHDAEWELWGMNQAYTLFERQPDRWFELHLPDAQPDVALPSYHQDLAQFPCPVYMIEPDPKISTSVRYPLDRVRLITPTLYHRYFTSSAAFMIALAMAEGFETIGLYGIDCTIGTEYETQKPCIEAWCSLAIGRTIEVIIPPTSSLFKTPFLYGYEAPKAWPRKLVASEAWLRQRITGHKVWCNERLKELHKCEGAIEELEELLNYAIAKSRGSQFPTVEAHE